MSTLTADEKITLEQEIATLEASLTGDMFADMDIKDKIIEKSGFDQVFHSDGDGDTAQLNSIKSRIEMNNRY